MAVKVMRREPKYLVYRQQYLDHVAWPGFRKKKL